MKILVILILLISNTYSQDEIGLATYAVKPIMSNKIKKSLEEGLIKQEIFDLGEELKPKLLFTKSFSKFYFEDDNIKKFNFSKALFCEYSSPKIIDFEKQEILIYTKKNRYFEEKEFVIVDYIKTDWVLLNETKEIDKHICLKAQLNYNSYSVGLVFSRQVIAWYCPEIPFSFGPNGYGGLPGLIVQLQTEDAVIGLEKLEFKKEAVGDIFLTPGKRITRQQYNEKMLEGLVTSK